MSPTPLSDLLAFLDASPSPYHAAANVAERLEAAGYARIDEGAAPVALPPGFRGFVHRAGSVVAFRVGAAPPVEAGFRVISAHTDSPNLRIKPQPEVRAHGYTRLGVEPYGGVLLATWTDRDLGLAGRVTVRDGGAFVGMLVDLREPILRVPNLAIHLNRGVNDAGLTLNAQTQLPPVFTQSDEPDPLRRLLAQELGVSREDIVSWDLGTFDLTPAAVGGLEGEFVFSGRLDNLASTHAGLLALLASDALDLPAPTAIVAAFDHEEIGSESSRGARSSLLADVVDRILRDATAQAPGGRVRAIHHSIAISADMAHAVHPGFADKHDAEHMPKLNAGPVIKQNVNQRYTTEADTAAWFMGLCERAEVPCQWFVNRSDLACGSTVGPMVAAALGIRSVDVGNPMLSMHSAREMAGSRDHAHMVAALTEALRA